VDGVPLSKKAYRGDSSGPSGGLTCPPTLQDGQWTWHNLDCAAFSAIDCPSCMKCSDCGWCPSLKKCYLGNNNGPTGLECPATETEGQWCYHSADCPMFTATTCAECMKCTDCGWCQSNQKCYLGSNNGPNPPISCPAQSWIYHASGCTMNGSVIHNN